MTRPRFDVTGIGNAIVDVLAHAEDRFLVANGVTKGAMTLIDAARAEALYAEMGQAIEVSGGSAANTIAGIASLGGAAAFIGKTAQDQLGAVFAHDIRAGGVHYATAPLANGAPTGRCLILVTPDAQRSMSTFLGAAQVLSLEDVDRELIAASSVTYLEGYLFDPPAAREAFFAAARVAHQAGRKVAFTLSDRFCIERHRAEMRRFVERDVDILFANESEIIALTETSGFDEAMHAIKGECEIAALTRSERGSVIVNGADTHVIDPFRLGPVLDTTGAGDLYAAGFLFGLTHGKDLAACGRLGSLAAAEIISHLGPRPVTSLKALAAKYGLL
jgi:sugar/nucleoside kinase (ribokinase family)